MLVIWTSKDRELAYIVHQPHVVSIHFLGGHFDPTIAFDETNFGMLR